MHLAALFIAILLPWGTLADWDPRKIDPETWAGIDGAHVERRLDTEPRSGKYLDPLLGIVYEYDAASDTLSATGESGNLFEYAQIDVYPRGQRPDLSTPSTAVPKDWEACGKSYCISAAVLLTGQHDVKIEVITTPLNCEGSVSTLSPPPKLARREVTYYDARYDSGACEPGKVTVHLVVDNALADADSTAY